ncbi:pantothenate synthetase [Paraliobacillus quinghaiensis]|uniref:Pantothenate synthetase n=1 Tax=Paraliobacillus quinghaiensis TaxID=470815 RepID=A0A917TGV5_9BACI|nr:pantoate--beta-alanine ligase [Paraliobacillus quinghaiensis]GGM23030.1 pantothenate synthetase [Paraliobacillus quinghaiensis]
MRIIKTIQEMQSFSIDMRRTGKTIGFVPTMGYLHEGHVALMKKSREINDVLITSIFVNPLQFGPNEDFEKYPRDEQRDIDIATENGVDVLFMPTVDEMYPTKQSIQIEILDRVDVLCGKSRPGHFDGVATVLLKLFHITSPDHVFFGKKDAQQVAVVDQLIKELNFPIQLHMVETVREEDGLAKSSRNVYLSPKERSEAVHLFKGLQIAQQKIFDGEKNPAIIVNEVKNYIITHTTGKIDYIEILRFPSLQPLTVIDQQIIVAVAVQFDQARLIDNLII